MCSDFGMENNKNMDEFLNNNSNENITEEELLSAKETEQNETVTEEPIVNPYNDNEENFEEGGFTEENDEQNFQNANEAFETVYNPIVYSDIKSDNDTVVANKGLKVFAFIMALIILLTGTCITGYFMGKNSVKSSYSGGKKQKVNLAARPTDTDELTEALVYEKVNESIVGIVVYNSKGAGSQASGIIYSEDGYIVTNDHIYSEVAGAKFKIYSHDGKEYDAKFVAGDKVSDLAVLKVDGVKFKEAKFGNSDELFHGEHVVAIGRPNDATDTSSITRGVISAVSRRVQTTTSYSARLIQTDSAINPGSSGGALVNMYGQIIGVTSSKLASSEYDAVGYAIPTTTMKRIVEELLEHGKVVSRAKLGVSYTAIDSITAEMNGYDYVGLYLAEISEESGLYGKAEKGDVITHINGIEITRDEIVLDIIEQSSAGDKVEITIINSKSETKTVEVELKANISESSYIEKEQVIENPQDGSSNNGGTFDFPFGE